MVEEKNCSDKCVWKNCINFHLVKRFSYCSAYVKGVSMQSSFDQGETGVLQQGDHCRCRHHQTVQLSKMTGWKTEKDKKKSLFFSPDRLKPISYPQGCRFKSAGAGARMGWLLTRCWWTLHSHRRGRSGWGLVEQRWDIAVGGKEVRHRLRTAGTAGMWWEERGRKSAGRPPAPFLLQRGQGSKN